MLPKSARCDCDLDKSPSHRIARITFNPHLGYPAVVFWLFLFIPCSEQMDGKRQGTGRILGCIPSPLASAAETGWGRLQFAAALHQRAERGEQGLRGVLRAGTAPSSGPCEVLKSGLQSQ